MAAAKALGHEYCALTDHSPRLTVANGLSPERLREQLDVIDELRDTFAPMRILTGIEVDILDDGSLDQDDDLLERLDVVVASVHSKLKMDSAAMTRRMVRAVSGGQADVLGHCTGRLVEGGRGTRPESQFDAEKVFTACRDHGTAVEINSRPERRDPPTRLLTLALEIGCDFSIDTDAHAPGQLDFLGYGAQRALDNGVPVDRIVNTWPVEKLLAWTDARHLVRQHRHLEPGIAAEQHAAHHRRVAEPLAHLVHRRVDRQQVAGVPSAALSPEDSNGSSSCCGAVAVDVGHRETDQRQPALGDQRARPRPPEPVPRRGSRRSTRWPAAGCATG